MIELQEAGFNNEEIKEMKGLPTSREVDVRIQAVKLAEEQLNFQGMKDKWSQVEKSEEIFTQAASSKIQNHIDKRAAELATIAINAATDDAVGTRRYKPVTQVLKNPGIIRKLLIEKAPKDDEEINPVTDEIETSNVFDEDEIISIISDPDKVDDLVEQVIEVLEEEEDKKASQGKRKLLKKKVDAAAKSLISAKDLTEESGYEVEIIQEKLMKLKLA